MLLVALEGISAQKHFIKVKSIEKHFLHLVKVNIVKNGIKSL